MHPDRANGTQLILKREALSSFGIMKQIFFANAVTCLDVETTALYNSVASPGPNPRTFKRLES